MDAEFVTLTPENLAQETLCCIVRTRTKHPGVEAKRAWLAERLPEGRIVRTSSRRWKRRSRRWLALPRGVRRFVLRVMWRLGIR